MAKEKSGLENVGKILILIDGILILLNSIFAFLGYVGNNISNPIPGVLGNNQFGLGALQLAVIINIIIWLIVGLVYISHFTGKFDMDSALVNGIVFLILGLVFGGLLTIIASILYIIAAFV